MKRLAIWICMTLLLGCMWPMPAQEMASTAATSTVPRLVNFRGILADSDGKPLAGQVSVIFSIYNRQLDNTPLWTETQAVEADKSGHYSVMLGATSSDGLPHDIFVTGAARWLGVQPEGQPEQPRTALLTIPYALKASDADTLGGLPASAFLTAGSQASRTSFSPTATPALAIGASPAVVSNATPSGSGTTDFVPLWTSSTNLGNSILFQSGGAMTVNGPFEFPAAGTATSTAGKNSQPLDQSASAFDSSTSKAVSQTFQWQAEPVGNDTSSPSATLNLLFGSGTTPAETGLKISNRGLLTFAAGQIFPGGTVTGSENIDGSLQAQFGSFTGNNTGDILIAQNQNTSGGIGIVGNASGTSGVGMEGNAFGSSGTGVQGGASGSNGIGVQGSGATGVKGTGSFPSSIGVSGVGGSGSTSFGVIGTSGGVGVSGTGNLNSGGIGVAGLGNIGVSGSGGTAGVGVQGKGAIGISGNGIGLGVEGVATGTSSQGIAGVAQHQGVVGISEASSGNHQGIFAQAFSTTGTGTLSFAVGTSKTGQALIGCCAVGVWGDTNQTSPGAAALVGTADNARGLLAQNNSPSGVPAAFAFNTETGTPNLPVFLAAGNVGGVFRSCEMDTNGNLACTGAKSAVVPVNNGQQQVALYAVEAPQNWFEDFGSGRLANGAATVNLDSTFAQTVNTASDYHVFLTPEGDCRGLYVDHKTASGFEVHELSGGKSSVAFAYHIVALRRGYENVRLEDMTARMNNIQAAQFEAKPERRP